MTEKFYGKYRGQVLNNVDPLQLGRVQVTCPAVLGSETPSWAMPNAPFAGMGVGLFAIPPIGTNVWVEFEGGEPDKPIWAGCFWGPGEVPATPAVPQIVTLKTLLGSITINEVLSSVTIETVQGARIALSPLGIEINNGQGATIQLTGPQVSVNNGALEVI